MSTFLGHIVASPAFNRFILGAIIVSAVLVGAETFPQFDPSTSAGRIVEAVQEAILWIFVVEVLMRMGAHGARPWRYFYDPWNVFDFVVVFISFLPLFTNLDTNYVSVLRMARVLRALRLVSALPHLQLLVTALLRSIPSIGYVGMLLALHFYVYAVAGTFLFRANDPLHFGDLSRSSLTLFQVLTMEGWPEYLRIQMHGSDLYYSDAQKRIATNRQSVGLPLVAAAYFVSFILFGTMIVMNLFTGVIVQSLEEAEDEVARNARERNDQTLGHTTVGDEINVLRERLEQISQRMHLLLSEQADALQAGFYED